MQQLLAPTEYKADVLTDTVMHLLNATQYLSSTSSYLS